MSDIASHYAPYFMMLARRLAENAAGTTAENPAVGCVIVAGGSVVGHGATAAGGRPHAETQALDMAGDAAHNADVYVTLEPCAHTGKTPPCAAALASACPKRVFIGQGDPDARVSGGGIRILQDAGIETMVARPPVQPFPHAPFVHAITTGRPYIILKSAATADGYSATVSGDSKWITGLNARMYGHRLRARTDGIIIGAATAIADDPSLTCRIPGKEHDSPTRIILDPHGRVPPSLAMFNDASAPDIIIIRRDDTAPIYDASCYPGKLIVVTCPYDANACAFDMAALLALSPIAAMRSLLVEGGGRTLAAFIEAGCADALYRFTAPVIVGDKGACALPLPAPEYMHDAWRLRETARVNLYPDMCYIYMFD